MTKATFIRHLLGISDVRILGHEFVLDASALFIDVKPRGMPRCARCKRQLRSGRYDSKERFWRHVDLGPWEVYLRGMLRRFRCGHCEAVVTENVPWAELGSMFTRDFEDIASVLAQRTDQTTVSRLLRIAWVTVGNIVRRTVARHQSQKRLHKLYRIGIDEISYRKHHKYLTLVANHATGHVVWGAPGRSGASLDGFLQ